MPHLKHTRALLRFSGEVLADEAHREVEIATFISGAIGNRKQEVESM
jgi:hypothetical protein